MCWALKSTININIYLQLLIRGQYKSRILILKAVENSHSSYILVPIVVKSSYWWKHIISRCLKHIIIIKLGSWVRNFCHCLHYRKITSRVSDRIRCRQLSSYTISNSYVVIKQFKFEFKEFEISLWKNRRFRLCRDSSSGPRIPAQSKAHR